MKIVEPGATFCVRKWVIVVALKSGMTAMRERANAIGARLHVDTSPGSGTWIRVEVDTGQSPGIGG